MAWQRTIVQFKWRQNDSNRLRRVNASTSGRQHCEPSGGQREIYFDVIGSSGESDMSTPNSNRPLPPITTVSQLQGFVQHGIFKD